MRRLLIAAALAVAAIPSAHAGVLCYAEASAGKNATATRAGDDLSGSVTIAADGLQGGIGLGCDWTKERLVLGVLARYDLQDVKGTIDSQAISGDAMWSVALRAGYKINDGTLVYGLGGLAGTDITYPGGIKINPDGLVWGGGLEIDLGYHNLSLFMEWDHVRWSKELAADTRLRPDTDIARVGLKIKFDVLK